MYVNSPGGSVTTGMAIFDTMRHIRPDVSTVSVCVGLAASAGTKGKRFSLANSRIMIHQPLGMKCCITRQISMATSLTGYMGTARGRIHHVPVANPSRYGYGYWRRGSSQVPVLHSLPHWSKY